MWKINLKKKSSISHWEISIFCTMQESDNVQHLIFPISALLICPVITHERLKTKKNFKLFSLFSRGGLTWEVPNTCIVIWHGNFWYFGKLVTEERKSLMRGGPNWRFHCVIRPMVMQGSVSQQGWIPPQGPYIIYLE